MTRHATAVIALLLAGASSGCARTDDAPDAATIARQYGVTGAVAETIATSAGDLHGTLVPVTMADGGEAHLFVPMYQSRDVEAVYLRDDQGLHAVQVTVATTRADLVRASVFVVRSPFMEFATPARDRDVFIVAGSTRTGAATAGLAADRAGGDVDAAAGGIGGLVYDLITQRRND